MPIITDGYNGSTITTPDNPHGTFEDYEKAHRERMEAYAPPRTDLSLSRRAIALALKLMKGEA